MTGVERKRFKRGIELVYQGGGRCESIRKGDVVVAKRPMNGGTRYWVRRHAGRRPGITTQISARYLEPTNRRSRRH